MRRLIAATAALAAVVLPLTAPGPVWAQGYFIPGQQHPAQGAAPSRPAPSRPAPRTQPAPQPQVQQQFQPPAPPVQLPQEGTQDVPPSIASSQLPPPPELPPLPKGVAPPTAIVGVLGVPEVMRASSAAQQVEKVIGERREKLNEDAQKEQNIWRDMQQALQNDRAKLSPEQIRTRERELQERITNAQRQFRERNTIIQQAAQVALAQIERTLIGVIRQVAESRNMNLVLHRAQVALNINDFDITDLVAEQLNKVLPSVQIPDDATLAAQAPAQAPGQAPGPVGAGATPVPVAAPVAGSGVPMPPGAQSPSAPPPRR